MARKLTPPKTIRLAGRNFKLEISQSPKLGKPGSQAFGQYHPFPGLIIVNSAMCDDQKKATVIHECFHDFDNQSSCDLGEFRVNTLSALFFAWMRDNPELIKWIMQE
jgi:hypothetical protein